MKSQLKPLAATLSFLVLVFVVMFVFNQTAQAVMLASSISPQFGKVVLFCLLGLYAIVIVVPVVIFVRLPKSLSVPADESSAEFQNYLEKLGRRLEKNSNLKELLGRLRTREEIQGAMKLLDEQSTSIIKNRASAVFLATAISQNGRLDALSVLVAQTRMIWEIAHIYNQRPSLGEMSKLYANVGSAVFLANEFQNLDISEQIEPTIRAVIGTTFLASIPGVTGMSSLVVQSVLEGTSNAYLTLRVGVVSQRLCGSITRTDRKWIAGSASVAAAGMLGSIVTASGGKLVQAIVTIAKNAGVSAVESAAGRVREVGSKLNPFT